MSIHERAGGLVWVSMFDWKMREQNLILLKRVKFARVVKQVKDTQDVPQFYLIFLDISFPIYEHLNLLIPQKIRIHYQVFF